MHIPGGVTTGAGSGSRFKTMSNEVTYVWPMGNGAGMPYSCGVGQQLAASLEETHRSGDG